MTRIASGVTDQYIYFVAVDATDLKTRETGLTTWTVYRSRNGGASAAMTTPTINETDSTNMPGVYELLLDEDMTIDAGDETQEMVFHITHSGMAPVTRIIELYRPKITAGNTLDVTSGGCAGIDWANVEAPTTTINFSGTTIKTATDVETDTADIQTRLPAALVSGRIDASVGAMAANTITAAATDPDFGTEVGTAVWATTTRTLTALDEDSTTLDLDATIRSAVGLASANLDTQIADLPTVAEFEARTPTAAQLAYIVANSATGVPVTFTTSGGSTTAAVLNQVDSAAASATNDQYNGRILVFTDGTLKGVVADITDYNGGTTTATITPIPTAPTSSHNARML